jgi:hypothetical protein
MVADGVGLAQGILGQVARNGVSGVVGGVGEIITGAPGRDERRAA